MKFSAFTVSTVSRMVSGTPTSGPERERADVGDRQEQERQLHAEQHHHAGRGDLAGQLGERVEAPLVVEHAEQADAARRRPARPSVWESSKVRCSAGSRVATRIAAATPRYIATPPPRGVGMTCTSRSRGAAIIRSRIGDHPHHRAWPGR